MEAINQKLLYKQIYRLRIQPNPLLTSYPNTNCIFYTEFVAHHASASKLLQIPKKNLQGQVFLIILVSSFLSYLS